MWIIYGALPHFKVVHKYLRFRNIKTCFAKTNLKLLHYTSIASTFKQKRSKVICIIRALIKMLNKILIWNAICWLFFFLWKWPSATAASNCLFLRNVQTAESFMDYSQLRRLVNVLTKHNVESHIHIWERLCAVFLACTSFLKF